MILKNIFFMLLISITTLMFADKQENTPAQVFEKATNVVLKACIAGGVGMVGGAIFVAALVSVPAFFICLAVLSEGEADVAILMAKIGAAGGGTFGLALGAAVSLQDDWNSYNKTNEKTLQNHS